MTFLPSIQVHCIPHGSLKNNIHMLIDEAYKVHGAVYILVKIHRLRLNILIVTTSLPDKFIVYPMTL